MNCVVTNEQKLCEDIFSSYLMVSDDKKAIFLWKTKEIRKLMALLEDKNNSSIVSQAITFILSLNRDEEPKGIDFRDLDASTQKITLELLKEESLVEKSEKMKESIKIYKSFAGKKITDKRIN